MESDYVQMYYQYMSAYKNPFLVFEQQLKKGNPEAVEIARSLRDEEWQVVEKEELIYHRVGYWFVKDGDDFESFKAVCATCLAKACGHLSARVGEKLILTCPNLWLVPIRFCQNKIKEYENEKYVQVMPFYPDWEEFYRLSVKGPCPLTRAIGVPGTFVPPREMGAILAFDLAVGHSDRFYNLYRYLDSSGEGFMQIEVLVKNNVNTDNFSFYNGRICSIDLPLEDTNTTRYLFRDPIANNPPREHSPSASKEVNSGKMKTALNWLAYYLGYNKGDQKELTQAYLSKSEEWIKDKSINHLWRLIQIYVNEFPFYY